MIDDILTTLKREYKPIGPVTPWAPFTNMD